MRGSQIYSNLTTTLENCKVVKGRNKELISKRNERLFYRYCFYKTEYRKLNYESVMELLKDEFCLSTTTISEIIQDNLETVRAILNEKPTVQELAKKFPLANWNIKIQ